MPEDRIFTVDELSERFKVPPEAMQQEIDEGNLKAFKVGGFVRVRESDVESFVNGASTYSRKASTSTVQSNDGKGAPTVRLSAAPDFAFTWPGGFKESYSGAREGIAEYNGKDFHVKMGFTLRKSAGKIRRRCLVLVDRYATVEFVSDGQKKDVTVASIIKDRRGKQMPVGANLPPEYQHLPTGAYRNVVIGPGASNGVAVICQDDDFDVMIRHALIRYAFRQERLK